ncbi:MAG TPA: phosphatase PAP2 family protein, partial [Gemmatimonadaceae bacterium]|nr:phosphatase PAP2 family protein [Gemmatimonadaceae bacterium]
MPAPSRHPGRHQRRRPTAVAPRPAALLAALLLLAAPRGAHAQRTLGTIGSDLKDGVGDILHVWSAPLRADGGEWMTFALVLAGTANLTLVDRQIHDLIQEHPSSVVIDALRPFREGARVPLVDLGSGKRLQPLSGALYVIGFIADSPGLRDAGMGCAAAQQSQTFVHSLVERVVSRTRPRQSPDDAYHLEWGYGPWEEHSFYGGHAANAMACATFFNERFDLGAAEPLLYVVALGVGIGRMADQRHWASDTFFGMAWGHAVGRMIGR